MRARNMQSLTEAIQRRWPGVTVFGKGDAAHAAGSSDHNEDDTPGVRTPQTDADNVPEHRAIDVMLGPDFTKADGDELVKSLLADPEARKRLQNIIWYRGIWSRSWGWTRRDYTGSDPHTNHPHISGWAGDDENAAGWPAVESGEADMFTCFCSEGQKGNNVKTVQYLLWNLGYRKQMPSGVDGTWGGETTAALKQAMVDFGVTNHAGKSYGPEEAIRISIMWVRRYSAGIKGDKGDPGPAGPPGELKLPATLVFKGTVEQGS